MHVPEGLRHVQRVLQRLDMRGRQLGLGLRQEWKQLHHLRVERRLLERGVHLRRELRERVVRQRGDQVLLSRRLRGVFWMLHGFHLQLRHVGQRLWHGRGDVWCL